MLKYPDDQTQDILIALVKEAGGSGPGWLHLPRRLVQQTIRGGYGDHCPQ